MIAVGRAGGDAALKLQPHHPVVMLAVLLLEVLIVNALLSVPLAFHDAHLAFRAGRRMHDIFCLRIPSAAAQSHHDAGGRCQSPDMTFIDLHLFIPPLRCVVELCPVAQPLWVTDVF